MKPRFFVFLIFIAFLTLLTETAFSESKLVLYFPFEEGKGITVNDASRSGNNGEIKGGAVWSQDGKYGNALEFNATDSYILVPTSPSLDITTKVTIMAWVKWVDAGDSWICIMASGQQNGPWESYGMFIYRSTKQIYFPLNLKSGFVLAMTKTTSPNQVTQPGTWQHLCGTYDGNKAIIYVDGKSVFESSLESELVPTKMDLRIGHRLGSTHYFNGLMDEVAIFEGALDENEIQKAMLGVNKFAIVESMGKLSTYWGSIKILPNQI
ncbi:MAG: hypothetical protein QG641_2854 [Candidatus Poribacteria bacterium]|nr:hypothetical protein [Candidatus Poribacteria bacterium]